MKKLYLMPQIRIAEIESGCLLADSITINEDSHDGISGDARKRFGRQRQYEDDIDFIPEFDGMFDWGN